MTAFLITKVEQAFDRQAIFGLELIDSVTLERVYRGFRVKAVGLPNEPSINASGVFYWLGQRENQTIESIIIEPSGRPYEPLILENVVLSNLGGPMLRSVELVPRLDYPFPQGTTGVMGSLVEDSVADPLIPIRNAQITLQVLVSGNWIESRIISRTNANGDFATILRLNRQPSLDDDTSQPAITLRILVKRGGLARVSPQWEQPFGDFRLPTPSNEQLFAWNSLN